MKFLCHRIRLAGYLLAVVVSLSFGQIIRDLIQPVIVTPGRTDTLLVSDLFYAKSYGLVFQKNDSCLVSFDPVKRTLVLQPQYGFAGATCLRFGYNGEQFDIPVVVPGDQLSRQVRTFVYSDTGKVNAVYVIGSFNSWDRKKDRMLEMSKGKYATTLMMEPGNYEYKFTVDGKEILDPACAEKVPNGFDNFNSVLRIVNTDTDRIFLHIGGYYDTKAGVTLSFFYESNVQTADLLKENVIVLLDNKRVDASTIELQMNMISCNFSKKELKGEHIVRLIVSQNRKASNLQQVVLNDGVPVGRKPAFNSWSDAMIYSIMIDRFFDGDTSNNKPVVHDSLFPQTNYQGGDFRGIIKKIEAGYFDSLGVNTLWISPVNDNPDEAYREYPAPHRWYSGYHGYWPISDRKVEEKFGTMKDLKELIVKAHRHSIKVLLDFVAHHVHIQHPFYKDHPDWFGTLDLPDGRKNLRLWDEQRLTTWFEPYMPSFDFTKSQVAVQAVSDNAIWWLKTTDADGFRHDAVKHVPNLFWRELTRKLKEQIEIPENRKVYQIGETFGDYHLVGSYVNNGQLNAQFNFNLSYFAIPVVLEANRTFAELDLHMKKSFAAFGSYHIMGNIMDSHDKVRFMAYADGKVKDQGVDTREMAWNNPPTVDYPSSYQKAELYYAYMFTIPGLPVIYYGSEFGMTGVDDPDNRRMMRFGDQLSSLEKGMLHETSFIVQMRRQHSALRYGDFLTLRADSTTYSYIRSDMNERLMILLNKTDKESTVDLTLPSVYPANTLTDIRSAERIAVEKKSVQVKMPAYGWRVFQLQ